MRQAVRLSIAWSFGGRQNLNHSHSTSCISDGHGGEDEVRHHPYVIRPDSLSLPAFFCRCWPLFFWCCRWFRQENHFFSQNRYLLQVLLPVCLSSPLLSFSSLLFSFLFDFHVLFVYFILWFSCDAPFFKALLDLTDKMGKRKGKSLKVA